jgi:hypothetical protein
MDNIVNLVQKHKDSELLGEGMSYLTEACARFMEMKAEEGNTIFRMTDAIMHYIENYLIEEDYLPKPTHEYAKEYRNDDSA